MSFSGITINPEQKENNPIKSTELYSMGNDELISHENTALIIDILETFHKDGGFRFEDSM